MENIEGKKRPSIESGIGSSEPDQCESRSNSPKPGCSNFSDTLSVDSSQDHDNTSDNTLECTNEFVTKEIQREERNLAKTFERKRNLEEKKRLKEIQEKEKLSNRKSSALVQLKFLLQKSEVYSQFLEDKITKSRQLQDVPVKQHHKRKHQKFNMNEMIDEELKNHSKKIKDGKGTSCPVSSARAQIGPEVDPLTYFENGSLRQYQVEGLVWMKVLFENGVNGILADEMGLGKTIQVIALLCALYEQHITGPFLIVAPLSTIPNWMYEFQRFAPKLPVVLFHGNADTRHSLYSQILKKNYNLAGSRVAPVVVTSFQIPLSEKRFLGQIEWKYIIVDEAHRIKNHESQLFMCLHSFTSINRLLLTGTPLQNNLRELWALLYFLLPEVFNDYNVFESWIDVDQIGKNDDELVQQEKDEHVLTMVHKILKPFMLRRMKSDVELTLPPKKDVIVYCPMSNKQCELYSFVINFNLELIKKQKEKDFIDIHAPRPKRNLAKKDYRVDLVDSDDEFEEPVEESIAEVTSKKGQEYIKRMTMQNTMFMFKKIVNHPYLVHFPIKYDDNEKRQLLVDENILIQSGKMLVLDAMLIKLREQGHKVLVFSTMTMLLDIIEEFMILKEYKYCRLDGGRNLEDRTENIDRFNKDPDSFVFLISTRAGGLGLNLMAADTVIVYDLDWNPQADLQAIARCHRIGQTRPVVAYQFITKGTIDEAILARATNKRKLEHIIMHKDKFKWQSKNRVLVEDDVMYLKRLLEANTYSNIVKPNGYVFTDAELDTLLDRNDLIEQMQQQSTAEDKENVFQNNI